MSSKQLFAVATVAGIAVAQKASSVAETSVHSRTTEEDQSAEMVDEELALKFKKMCWNDFLFLMMTKSRIDFFILVQSDQWIH